MSADIKQPRADLDSGVLISRGASRETQEKAYADGLIRNINYWGWVEALFLGLYCLSLLLGAACLWALWSPILCK